VIPIWRGYIEHSIVKKPSWWKGEWFNDKLEIPRRVYPILGTRLRPATYRHRVELLSCGYNGEMLLEGGCPKCAGQGVMPAWSIFIRFKRIREWGFWESAGWVSWKQWWNDLCED
jgi:hypothetical protein